MKMIIDIHESIIEHIKDGSFGARPNDKYLLAYAAMEGIRLPEKHGRLIDADEALKAMDTWDKFGFEHTGLFVRNPEDDFIKYVHYDDMVKSVRGAETIIEADKEGT